MFFAHRDRVISISQSNRERQDAAVLTLSTTVLAGSIVFLKDLANYKDAGSLLVFLVLSWILFFMSITFTLISFMMSRKDMECSIKNAEDYYINNDDSAPDRKNIFQTLVEFFTMSAGVCFLLALLSLVFFVSYVTVKKGLDMSDKNLSTTTRLPEPDLQKANSSVPIQRIPTQQPSQPSGNNGSRDGGASSTQKPSGGK